VNARRNQNGDFLFKVSVMKCRVREPGAAFSCITYNVEPPYTHKALGPAHTHIHSHIQLYTHTHTHTHSCKALHIHIHTHIHVHCTYRPINSIQLYNVHTYTHKRVRCMRSFTELAVFSVFQSAVRAALFRKYPFVVV
jgi:hypothetical protein